MSGSSASRQGVHLWTASVRASPPASRLVAFLSADERVRANCFRRRADYERFITGRAGLRLLLGEATGRAPESLAFAYGSLGKPSLVSWPNASPAARFNISHSDDRVAWAVSDSGDIGIDIEAIVAERIDADLTEAVLSRAEWDGLTRLQPAAFAEAFFACWTAKEACLKAIGLGFAVDPRDVDVRDVLSPAREATVALPSGPAVTVRALGVGPGYQAAWAMEAPRAPGVTGATPMPWPRALYRRQVAVS